MKLSSLLAIILLPILLPAAVSAQTQASVLYNVPHIRQAPTGNWNAVFKDACEETAILMAMNWVLGNSQIDPVDAENQIRAMADLEMTMFGFHQDTSAQDTARLMKAYFNYEPLVVRNIGVEDIKQALARRELVIVPVNAAVLKIYRRPPSRHMVVVTGFDPLSGNFTINDPLMVHGNVPIPASRLQAALRDYPSGIHNAVKNQSTAMIVVAWPWLDPPL